jgi:hypothetical protein
MIDTVSSFVAGYAVAAVLIVAYIASLAIRSRRLTAKMRVGASGRTG